MEELKVRNNTEMDPLDMTLENRIDIIGEGLRRKYLSRLNEMKIAPVGEILPLEEDLIDNVRLYHITEMVYEKGEPVTDKFTTVFNTLSTYNASVFIVMDSDGKNTNFYVGVRNDEEDGVYSRSFTSEQINNWAGDRWNLPVNKPFSLEFRVIVEFTGGPEFQAPEVRTVTVNVTPIHVDIFATDKMYIDGTSSPGKEEVSATLEN